METKKQSDSDIVAALEQKLEQLVSGSAQQHQLAELSKANKQLTDKLKKTEDAKAALQEQLTDRKRRVGFLKEERTQLQADFEELQQQLKQMMADKEAADTLAKAKQAENVLLHEQLQTQQHRENQHKEFVIELNQQLADAQQQRALLIQQLNDFINDQKKSADELANAQASVQQRFTELAKLTEQLVVEQDKNKSLQQNIKKLEQKNDWLRSKLKTDKQ